MSKVPPNVEIDMPVDWPAPLSFVRDYWMKKSGSRAMPGRDDIRPSELKKQLPYLLLADVVDGGRDFRYRLVGTQLSDFFTANPSGKLMSEALASFGEETVDATVNVYRSVMERRAPMRLTGSGSWFGQDPKRFDALLAPLSADGETVDMIMGTFVFVWDQDHPFRKPEAPRAHPEA